MHEGNFQNIFNDIKIMDKFEIILKNSKGNLTTDKLKSYLEKISLNIISIYIILKKPIETITSFIETVLDEDKVKNLLN